MLKSNQKNLFDRLYKNMLELVNRRVIKNVNFVNDIFYFTVLFGK